MVTLYKAKLESLLHQQNITQTATRADADNLAAELKERKDFYQERFSEFEKRESTHYSNTYFAIISIPHYFG